MAESTTYPAASVANYFLELAKASGKKLTPMHVQKLVYFAHGWSLALRNQPLVDEFPEAWSFGPVFADLYHAVKHYGPNPIRSPITDGPFAEVPIPDDGDVLALIERIWDVYGGLTANQMSNLTHMEGTPWSETRKRFPGRRGSDIDDDLIRTHFRSLRRSVQEQP